MIIYRELVKCISLTIPGFNAIFFVLQPTRFSDEIVKTVDLFFEFFGQAIEEYAFVILTFTKNEQAKAQYIGTDDNKGHEKLRELVERCQGKVLYVDNMAGKEHQNEFVLNCFKEIDKNHANLTNPYYTNTMIQWIDTVALRCNHKHTKKYWQYLEALLSASEDCTDTSPLVTSATSVVPQSSAATEQTQSTPLYPESDQQTTEQTQEDRNKFKNNVESDLTFLNILVRLIRRAFQFANNVVLKFSNKFRN